jgi:hypothetical protein
MCPSLVTTGIWRYVLPKFYIAEINKNLFGGCRVAADRQKYLTCQFLEILFTIIKKRILINNFEQNTDTH